MTVRALVIQTNGTFAVTDTATDLDALRALIGGGWLEGVVSPWDETWHAYCDEEGGPDFKRLPVNLLATALALMLGWPKRQVLSGPVVFLGSTDEGKDARSEEADVPEYVVSIAKRLAGQEES